MAVTFKVISIGTLSRNPFWQETEPVRTVHATTTLVTAEKPAGSRQHILVDPALPSKILDARLHERAGIRIGDISIVFLTTFRASHRMALQAFDGADWYLDEREKEFAKQYLDDMHFRYKDKTSDQASLIENDLALLERCRPAPKDSLADQVQVFPSPGASTGCCGLLLTAPVGTVVIAGDAVISQEYLEHGQVWDYSTDPKAARQSLQDILEIADIIVPGHDNMIPRLGKFLPLQGPI